MAYIINIVCYLLRKIHFHIFVYLVLFIIYIVNFYLRYSFGTDISPKILLLVFETNPKEVSGFFKTYLMTDGMYKTIGAFVIVVTSIILGERLKNRIRQMVNKPVFLVLLTIIVLFGVIGGASALGRYTSLRFLSARACPCPISAIPSMPYGCRARISIT